MKYAYIRVSTKEQNEDRQIEAMKKYDIPAENYFTEKASGKNTLRPELMRMLTILKPGDVVHIHDFSRLARSTKDLLDLVEYFQKNDVTLVSNKESIDTSTPAGKLMLTMIGAIYEFERENMLERQREGIQCAKDKGTYKKKDVDMELFAELKADVDKGLLTVTTAAQELGVSRLTWYRLVEKTQK